MPAPPAPAIARPYPSVNHKHLNSVAQLFGDRGNHGNDFGRTYHNERRAVLRDGTDQGPDFEPED